MRFGFGTALVAGLALLAPADSIAAPMQDASAASRSAATIPGTLQWTGCWDLQNTRDDGVEPEAGSRRLCVQPRDGGLEVVTLVHDEEVRRDQLFTDGSPRQVQDGGCAGTEHAVSSADGQRIYTRADLVCEGAGHRLASGISALLSPDVWIDIQVVRVDDERELMVRRFRHAGAASRALWEQGGRDDLTLAARTARTGAAERLDVDDVIEATGKVDAAAIEALLVESQASFALDAGVLIRLADAEVPGEVIDLMVALSFPDYFVINDEATAEPPGPAGYGYPVASVGYWSPAFAPFGWGYYYPWYPVGRPPSLHPPVRHYGGRAVAGRGYARVAVNPEAPRGGFAGFLSRGGSSDGARSSSGSKGGTASKSGHKSGGSSGSKRTAKRRGG